MAACRGPSETEYTELTLCSRGPRAGSDESPGTTRFGKDIVHLLRYHMNAAVFKAFCFGHQVGNALGGALDECIGAMVRMGKLLRFHEYWNGHCTGRPATQQCGVGMTHGAGAMG